MKLVIRHGHSLIGRFFLHERLSAYRIIACCVVAVGAICICHDGGPRHAVPHIREARFAN